jgi:hypothetical protein
MKRKKTDATINTIIQMKEIKIFRIRYYDDNTQYFFKGIEELRNFAKDRIFDGWETEINEKDLNDDKKLFDFLNNDYGEELSEIMKITLNDFNN